MFRKVVNTCMMYIKWGNYTKRQNILSLILLKKRSILSVVKVLSDINITIMWISFKFHFIAIFKFNLSNIPGTSPCFFQIKKTETTKLSPLYELIRDLLPLKHQTIQFFFWSRFLIYWKVTPYLHKNYRLISWW